MITAFLFNADGGSDTLIVNRSPGVSYGSNPFNGNVTFLGGYKSIAYLNVEILTTN
ncbi:MAG: hypothetical protein K2V38_20380 [Gemmataceae bacterium]|nr:hypothetical protein [Gemmataceae bacterium]